MVHWACFAIHSVMPRTVPVVVFVVESSFDNPGCPRGVLLRLNLPILLAMVKHECCFAGENLSRLVQKDTMLKDTTSDVY